MSHQPWPRATLDRSIPALFADVVRAYGERIAIQEGNIAYTYSALDCWSDGIARLLLRRLGREPEPVALLLSPGSLSIAALMGVLKAGKLYVPFAADAAPERLARLLENTQARLALVDGETLPFVASLDTSGCNLLKLGNLPGDFDDSDALGEPDEPLPNVEANALAGIVYTSGTSGEPKGVYFTHRAQLATIRHYTNFTRATLEDRFSLSRSISFNGATKEIFGALLNGAALLPFDLKRRGYGALAQWLRLQRITIFTSVSTVARQFISTLGPEEQFPDLRLAQIGAEALYGADLRAWRRHTGPHFIVGHGFGTSETGRVSAREFAADMEIPDGALSPGYPAEDREVLILDEAGHPLLTGEIGEIAVRGPDLAEGYWNQPDLTATVFRPDPDGGEHRIYCTGDLGRLGQDGALYHLGRRDFEKVWGQRVSLAEIEGALWALAGVVEAAAATHARADGEQSLVAYLVLRAESRRTLEAMRQELAAHLPSAFMPSHIVLLDEMPKTAMGKTDRKRLPAPSSMRPALATPYRGPRTPLEAAVTAIWQEVLGIERVGIDDPFLDLGGNSLQATQIVARISSLGEVELTPDALFATPTPAAMTLAITARQAEQLSQARAAHLFAEVEARQ